ncbi:MAG: repeat-containing protein YrrB [Planctomycetota bacterium]
MTSIALPNPSGRESQVAGGGAARSPWFHSARFDLPLILLTPLLVWPLVRGMEGAFGASLVLQLILLTATGHYFATFVRTYGDRELFARFRTRLIAAPLLLLTVCVGMFATGHEAALLIGTTAWAFWHWLAQAFGFARIYDIKVGSYAPLTALLDKAVVVGGFVGTVVLNAQSTAIFGKVWMNAGLAMPSAAAWATVQTVTTWLLVGLGALYVGNLLATIARGLPWSWQKQVMHVVTIGYYWFAYSYAPNAVVAYVLYELFHDIQYFAITWLMCGQRARRPGVTGWFAAMFRPGMAPTVLFVGAMLAMGGIDALGRANISEGTTAQKLWLGVYLALALMHYYFDGFVWKARERTVGADLGIAAGRADAAVPGLKHAARWLGFFVPIGLALQFGGTPLEGLERAKAMVAVADGDFLSQSEVGFELTKARQLDEALQHYAASVELHGEFGPTRLNYGSALELAGKLVEAEEQYEAALRCPDRDGVHRQARLNRGVLRLLKGDRNGAVAEFTLGGIGSREPRDRIMARAAATEVPARREGLYRAALVLDPMDGEASYNLGLMLGGRQQWQEASTYLLKTVEVAPTFVPGLVAAANVLARLGRFDEARGLCNRALAAEPGNQQAKALLAQLPQ